MEKYQLLFFDTFIHNGTDLNVDLISFRGSVTIGEVRVIPLGARVCANLPGGERMGATNPSQFVLDLFVNDLAESGLSVFQPIGSIDYDQKRAINLVLDSQVPTDGLIVRGRYSTITLAVYGLSCYSQHHHHSHHPQQQQCDDVSRLPLSADNSSAATTESAAVTAAADDDLMASHHQQQSEAAQCQQVSLDGHVTRTERIGADDNDVTVAADRTSSNDDKPPVSMDTSVTPVDVASSSTRTPALSREEPEISCGGTTTTPSPATVSLPIATVLSSSSGSNPSSAQSSAQESTTASSIVSTAGNEPTSIVNTSTVSATVENDQQISSKRPVVPIVNTAIIDGATEVGDFTEETRDTAADSITVSDVSPQPQPITSASTSSLVDLLMTTDDMESISDEEIQELESNHDPQEEEVDVDMTVDDSQDPGSDHDAPNVDASEVVASSTSPEVRAIASHSGNEPPTTTAPVSPSSPLDASAGAASTLGICDFPAPAELEDIESEDDLMDDETASVSGGLRDDPVDDCVDLEDECGNVTFDPLSFQPSPLKALSQPWLSRYQRCMLTPETDVSSDSVSARREIDQLLSADVSNPESLVETIEQLNRLFDITWISLENDSQHLAALTSLLIRGLDYTRAAAQFQLPYKIRQIKSALRLCCHLLSTSDTVCSQLLARAAANGCEVLQLLLDVCGGEFMAVSLKLLAVRALSFAVRWPCGIKVFIKLQDRGMEETEPNSCYERVIVNLLDKNQSRLKAAYTKLIRKVHVYHTVCQFCTLSEHISREHISPDFHADHPTTSPGTAMTTSTSPSTTASRTDGDGPGDDLNDGADEEVMKEVSDDTTLSASNLENAVDKIVHCLNKLKELMFRSGCLVAQSYSTHLPLCPTTAGDSVCSCANCSWCDAASAESDNGCGLGGALSDLFYTLSWAGFGEALVVLVSSPAVVSSASLCRAVSALITEMISTPSGLLGLSTDVEISSGLLTSLLTRSPPHQPTRTHTERADILHSTGCRLARHLYIISQLDLMCTPSPTLSNTEDENCLICASYSSERFDAAMSLLHMCWSSATGCDAVASVLCSGSGHWLLMLAQQLRPPASSSGSCPECSDSEWCEQPMVLAILHLLEAIVGHVVDDCTALCRLARFLDTVTVTSASDSGIWRDSSDDKQVLSDCGGGGEVWLNPLRMWLVPTRMLDDIGALCAYCNTAMASTSTPAAATASLSDQAEPTNLDWCKTIWPVMRHLCALITTPFSAKCGVFERQYVLSSAVAMCAADVLHMATSVLRRITGVALLPATLAVSCRLIATTVSGRRVLCVMLVAVRLIAAQLAVMIDTRQRCSRDLASPFADSTAIQPLIDSYVLAWLVEHHCDLFVSQHASVVVDTSTQTIAPPVVANGVTSEDVSDVDTGYSTLVARLRCAIVDALSAFTLSAEPLPRAASVTCTRDLSSTSSTSPSSTPFSETLCSRMWNRVCDTVFQSAPMAIVPCISLLDSLISLPMPSDQHRVNQWVANLTAGCAQFLVSLMELLALTSCRKLSEAGLKLLGRLACSCSSLGQLVAKSVLDPLQQYLTSPSSQPANPTTNSSTSDYPTCYIQLLTRLVLFSPDIKLAVLAHLTSPVSSSHHHQQQLFGQLLQILGSKSAGRSEERRSARQIALLETLLALCNPAVCIELTPCSTGDICRLPCETTLNSDTFSRLLTGVPPPSLVEALVPPLFELLATCSSAEHASVARVLHVLTVLASAPAAQIVVKRHLLEKSCLADVSAWLCTELRRGLSVDLATSCDGFLQLLNQLEKLLSLRQQVAVLRWCEHGEEAGELVDTPLRLLLKQLQSESISDSSHFSAVSERASLLVSRLEGDTVSGEVCQQSATNSSQEEQQLSFSSWPQHLQLPAVWAHRKLSRHPPASPSPDTLPDRSLQRLTVDLGESVWPILDCKESLPNVLSRQTATGLAHIITLTATPSVVTSQNTSNTTSSNLDAAMRVEAPSSCSPPSAIKPPTPRRSVPTTPASTTTCNNNNTVPTPTTRPTIDHFRSRPPNTSRPPSLHVDEFVALELRAGQLRMSRVGGDCDPSVSMRRRRRRRGFYRPSRGSDPSRPTL